MIQLATKELTMELNSDKVNEVIDYCLKYSELMWAATIWSMLTGNDFRDIPHDKNRLRVSD